jgi:predicted GNAT family acetyltransferase
MTLEARHEPALQRFAAPVGEGKKAVLEYRVAASGVLDYYHTFVPREARGRGVASQLASFALEYARAQGYLVRPSCPFVSRFVAANPQYADLVESSQ